MNCERCRIKTLKVVSDADGKFSKLDDSKRQTFAFPFWCVCEREVDFN